MLLKLKRTDDFLHGGDVSLRQGRGMAERQRDACVFRPILEFPPVFEVGRTNVKHCSKTFPCLIKKSLAPTGFDLVNRSVIDACKPAQLGARKATGFAHTTQPIPCRLTLFHSTTVHRIWKDGNRAVAITVES